MKQLTTALFLTLFLLTHSVCSQNIELPAADHSGGIPLMEALSKRQSNRAFSSRPLPLQDLSDLCWAAWGFNRDDKRTAPSSQNKQEMELYVFLENGIYKYNAEQHILELLKKGDFRQHAGLQDFVATAPLNFVYVSNLAKAGVKTPEAITTESLIPSHANSGFMAQNVYLTAASKNLGCVIRAWVDADELHKILNLNPMQKALYGQTVGYRK